MPWWQLEIEQAYLGRGKQSAGTLLAAVSKDFRDSAPNAVVNGDSPSWMKRRKTKHFGWKERKLFDWLRATECAIAAGATDTAMLGMYAVGSLSNTLKLGAKLDKGRKKGAETTKNKAAEVTRKLLDFAGQKLDANTDVRLNECARFAMREATSEYARLGLKVKVPKQRRVEGIIRPLFQQRKG